MLRRGNGFSAPKSVSAKTLQCMGYRQGEAGAQETSAVITKNSGAQREHACPGSTTLFFSFYLLPKKEIIDRIENVLEPT